MKHLVSIILIVCIITGSCKKGLDRFVLVTTDSIYKADTSVFIAGTIVDAGDGIDNYGHCWSLSPEPLISSDTSSFGVLNHGLHFNTKLRNLIPGQTYYIRAYTKSKSKITYGNTLSFQFDKTVVSIESAYLLTLDSIKVNASISLKNSDHLSSCGICWKAGNSTPTINDSVSSFPSSPLTSEYVAYMHNFSSGKPYSVRSYAMVNSRVIYSKVLPITTGSMIFYNTLDAFSGLHQSEASKDIETINYKILDTMESKFLPAKFGKGLFINQNNLSEAMADTGANFFAIDATAINLSAKSGCVEFWFIFKCSSTLMDKGYFFSFADSFANHFSDKNNNLNIYMSAGWNGWWVSESQRNFFFTIGNATANKEITIQSSGLIKFKTDDAAHFAFVWDAEGICGSKETMRIYMNGEVIAAASQQLDSVSIVDRYMYLGSVPGNNTLNQKYNAVEGITDNLKIFNFAKVSFNNIE